MTGDELVALLQAMPPEQRALEVALWAGHCGCGDDVASVTVERPTHRGAVPFISLSTEAAPGLDPTPAQHGVTPEF